MKNFLQEFGTYDASTGMYAFSDVRSGLIVAMVCILVVLRVMQTN